MWHDTKGEWPVEAWVLYPLAGTNHPVDIEPSLCQEVATESRQIVARMRNIERVAELAMPGDVCQVCEFRPWCQPFWRWQAGHPTLTSALDRAAMGFEGTISQLELTQFRWWLSIAWHGAEIQLSAAQERFAHLAKTKVGTKLRVLDTELRGLRHQPRAVVTEYSELFVVE
jgi:hypothetical protein